MGLQEKIRALPLSPGVYIMKDARQTVLYVGKAGQLRKRVSSYFSRSHANARLDALVSNIADISYIPTQNEAEALIYESSLIKSMKPKYNVELKDDKTYPYLKITLNEDFPRLLVTRRVKRDGAKYFGPYTNVKLLRQALTLFKRFFPLRTCSKLPKRPCLNYHIGQCAGPCIGKITKTSYGALVDDLILLLSGKKDTLIERLSARMLEASKAKNYEYAAVLRDQIDALNAAAIHRTRPGAESILDELKQSLGLRTVPKRIETFDISNTGGKEAVGVMVSFFKGKPDKHNYRRFKIRTIQGIDDYEMIREVVNRRYARLSANKAAFPDLIVIDGGIGHLAAATGELDKLNINIPVISIAKEHEHIYAAGNSMPVILPKESRALKLVQRMRDEAHRFAINYHRLLRSKAVYSSPLDGIPGIGMKRKADLMRRFLTIGALRHAQKDELLKVKGVHEKEAQRIIEYFKAL